MDELERRERALRAERLRPEKPVTIDDLLGELIQTLHQLYLTPPDASPVDKSVDERCKDFKGAA